MIELTSPPLRNCPHCDREPITDWDWRWKDLSVCFLSIKCPKCETRTPWVKYTIDDDMSFQKAIDETSHWWNNFII